MFKIVAWSLVAFIVGMSCVFDDRKHVRWFFGGMAWQALTWIFATVVIDKVYVFQKTEVTWAFAISCGILVGLIMNWNRKEKK